MGVVQAEKEVITPYKKQGFKCQNTEVLLAANGLIQARKICSYDNGKIESAKIMEIEAFLMDDVSEAIVTNIRFNIAG